MGRMSRAHRWAVAWGLLLCAACAGRRGRVEVVEPHLWTGISSRAEDGAPHVLVEIPAGTNAKWEVDKELGVLRWEEKHGKPRVVDYLPYPGNYGMVPRTLLPAAEGGDGDPLDVLVLGPAVARGTLLRVRILGALRLLDGGEQDDKLLAVAQDSPMSGVRDLDELEARYPGATRIVETWFTHYKGPGVVESRGFVDRPTALELLERSEAAFAVLSRPEGAAPRGTSR